MAKKKKKENDEIKIISDGIDESIYTRVTTPLKVFSSLDKVPEMILDYAADRGSRIHSYCELYSRGCLFEEVDEDCLEYVQAFIDWFDDNVQEVIFTEQRLYSDDFMIQGCIDMICVLNKDYLLGKPCVIDIKTSYKPSKTWALQTAAYKHLCLHNNTQVADRVIVHLKKDGSYDQILSKDNENFSNYTNDLEVYLSALHAHRYFNS